MRVQVEPGRLMPGAQDTWRILGDLDRWRHLGQRPTIRPSELQLAVRLTLDLEALFVDRAVVPSADEYEVGQRRGPALGPVPDVMPLADAHAAARKATAAVAMLQRPA